MAERIVTTDPKAAALEERCIAELKGFYPNLVIKGSVDKEHKKLGERLASARKLIGYESRSDMLEAWGFQVVGGKVGRPKSFDAEELIAEIARRYEGKAKPNKVSQITAENPDLASKIKTASNLAHRLFGSSLTRELGRRGILVKANSAPVDDIDETPSALSEAREKHKVTISPHGSEGKPQMPKKGARARIVRKAELPVLGKALVALAGTSCIEPGTEQSAKLPPHVLGIDIKAGVELKCAQVCLADNKGKYELGSALPSRTITNIHAEHKELFKDLLNNKRSPLAASRGSAVTDSFSFGPQRFVKTEVRYLLPLRKDTLLYALREYGVLTDEDLRGSNKWAQRFEKLA